MLTSTAPDKAPDAARPQGDGTAIRSLQYQLAQLATVNDLIERIQSTANLQSGSQRLADLLQDHFQAKHVFIGLCEDSRECRLTAIARVPSFRAQDPIATAATNVLHEAIARGEVTSWPEDQDQIGGLLSHQRFACEQDVYIVSGPLKDPQGVLRGAWVVTGIETSLQSSHIARVLNVAAPSVATTLHTLRRCDHSPANVLRAAQRTLRKKLSGNWILVWLTLAALCALPWKHRPQCQCTVEPVERRFVAAPFDGPLQDALVRPGDEVEEGQLLARMDGREVRWELAGMRADFHRADKQLAGHLASHDSGQAQVAKYEVERLRCRTTLLESRDRNIEVRSPIGGIIVTGDWEDAAGMPVDTGQTLFEIAPLDKMVVELAIAEDNYAHVKTGMSVRIRLDAFPLRKIYGTIREIHQRAELRDGKNIFVAEVAVDNRQFELRPGMHGVARVTGNWRPVGWILFRRPATAFLRLLGW